MAVVKLLEMKYLVSPRASLTQENVDAIRDFDPQLADVCCELNAHLSAFKTNALPHLYNTLAEGFLIHCAEMSACCRREY